MKIVYKLLFSISIFIFSNLFLIDIKAIDGDIYSMGNDVMIYPIKEEKMIDNLLTFYQENNKSLIRIVVNENRINKKVEIDEIEDNIIDNIYEEDENSEIEIVESNYYYEETANFDSKYTDLAIFAQQFVGNPYVYGGTSLTEGADCSGFVMKLYENYGVTLPRTAGDQSTVGYAVSIENAQPGDIISYGYDGIVGHSAIYIGNEMIVHASTPEGGIRIDSMYMMPIITIRRIG